MTKEMDREVQRKRELLQRLSAFQTAQLVASLPPSVVTDLYDRAMKLSNQGWQV